MELSPSLYSYLVRPKWFSKLYIHNILTSQFDFKNKIVLDFGSGTGSNSLMFEPSSYLGVDINPVRVKYARKQYPDYKFMVLEDKHLSIASNSLNYIVIIAVLHHISTEELVPYIQEFHRVLKPNGKVVVLEPYYCEFQSLNNSFMKIFDNGNFIRNEKQYMSLFEQENFSPMIKKKFKKILYNEILIVATPN